MEKINSKKTGYLEWIFSQIYNYGEKEKIFYKIAHRGIILSHECPKWLFECK